MEREAGSSSQADSLRRWLSKKTDGSFDPAPNRDDWCGATKLLGDTIDRVVVWGILRERLDMVFATADGLLSRRTLNASDLATILPDPKVTRRMIKDLELAV